ncbi:lytic transglycosylase domain-containing protein [Citreimonas salinaria]|uniref:Soluble lytic murein transglycosylase n=1 Tax=Citreimonas salinaria TaxID=321339 RepID=A0A1H3HZ37_9RHOB|nr:lytic transglycosylase domain-containing protein [Citreimonas salinaria]SDY20723.1 soluble lytic murein transglycosylase [Citreimonas salinaria]
MTRILTLCLALVLSTHAAAQDGAAALGRAMDAVRAGDWDDARSTVRGAGQIGSDIVTWHALRAGRGTPEEVTDFLTRNPDWPGLPYLRERAEPVIAGADPAVVRAFFDDRTPQTGDGALALAQAHLAAGETGPAEVLVVLAWRTLALDGDGRKAFLDHWGDLLRPHHEARLDMALWRGWTANAGAMLPLVDDGWRRLAEARMGLRADAAGVDGLIARVPDRLSDHPGLAHERFLWRVRKGRAQDATDLLLERSTSAAALGEPWAWADARSDLARDLMREGDVVQAYRVASTHYLVDGSDFPDLEWLSGYLALRFLNRPDLALQHFEAFHGAIDTPISLGRAGYWLGRAHEALDNAEAAATAYAMGARYQTTFYGLLAAERAGLPVDPALAGTESFGDWKTAPWTESSVFKAGMLLLEAGENRLGERFLTHLAESLDRDGMGQIGAMFEEMGRPHMQVMLGKRAAQFGHEIPGPYYAVHPLVAQAEYPVPRELVLSIARRESEFDPVVISGAGARGFMQLMPGTAKDVAGWLDLEYDVDRLLSDPVYNAKLGAAYLANLARRFGGNVVMMAAGYNAGPSRPYQWIERFGDPRGGGVDVIDWIEFIPFDETRNYVMRVAESLPVYRARLGKDPHPVPFSQELAGATLATN